MTPKQLRELADKLEAENSGVVKTAKLANDLYQVSIQGLTPYIRGWLFKKDVDNFLDECKKSVELVLKKDTPFICFIEGGEESWYDDVGYGIEMVDSKWAAKNLYDIKEVSPK